MKLPSLFNIFMDGVVTEVNARLKEQETNMVYGSERKWKVSRLLFGDETIVIGDSWKKMLNLIPQFGRQKFKLNIAKSKVISHSKDDGQEGAEIVLNGEILEHVAKFLY